MPEAPIFHLSETTRWAATPHGSDGCRVFQDGFDFVHRPPLCNCFHTIQFQPNNVAGFPEHLVKITDLQLRCHHYEEESAGPYRSAHTEGSKSAHEEQSALFLPEERCCPVQFVSFGPQGLRLPFAGSQPGQRVCCSSRRPTQACLFFVDIERRLIFEALRQSSVLLC